MYICTTSLIICTIARLRHWPTWIAYPCAIAAITDATLSLIHHIKKAHA